MKNSLEYKVACLNEWENRANPDGSHDCEGCGRGIAECVPFHHKIKRSQGGDHSPENLEMFCVVCHEEAHRPGREAWEKQQAKAECSECQL
jgi:5-methylcytosine-specific restriction endonuclease McrA